MPREWIALPICQSKIRMPHRGTQQPTFNTASSTPNPLTLGRRSCLINHCGVKMGKVACSPSRPCSHLRATPGLTQGFTSYRAMSAPTPRSVECYNPLLCPSISVTILFTCFCSFIWFAQCLITNQKFKVFGPDLVSMHYSSSS